jgi:hypothetical protein
MESESLRNEVLDLAARIETLRRECENLCRALEESRSAPVVHVVSGQDRHKTAAA